MADFAQRKPSNQTREGRRLIASKTQTTRSLEEQRAHEKAYGLARTQRARALEGGAKERLRLHLTSMAAPFKGALPFGQFSPYQLAIFDFSLNLPLYLSESMLLKPQSTINSAALQACCVCSVQGEVGCASIDRPHPAPLPTSPLASHRCSPGTSRGAQAKGFLR